LFIFIGLGVILVHTTVFGATRGDVNVLEATESIRYLSQKMAREYLYVYLNPHNSFAKRNLSATIEKLGENIRRISAASNDEETATMLEFIAYTKEQIAEIARQKPSDENAALMLDYSETLLEGADAIAKAHLYDFGREEKMLVRSKKLQFLLERVLKYYMALYIGNDSQSNIRQLNASIKAFDETRLSVASYDYPDRLQPAVSHIAVVWNRSKPFLYKAEKERYFITELISDAVISIEKRIEMLVLYHSKKL
jgi:hypothetical protein